MRETAEILVQETCLDPIVEVPVQLKSCEDPCDSQLLTNSESFALSTNNVIVVYMRSHRPDKGRSVFGLRSG